MKTIFLIRSLEAGGAERVFATYVDSLRAYEPLVVLHDPIIDRGFEVSPRVTIRPIIENSRLRRALALVPPVAKVVEAWLLARIARQSGARVIVSFLFKSNRVAILTKRLFARDLHIVLTAHEHLSQHIVNAHAYGWERALQRRIARSLWAHADRVIAVSNGVKDDLVREFGAAPAKVEVVSNPIDAARIRARGAERVEYPFEGSGRCHLITVGRLSPEKGLDFLARSLAGVDTNAFDWVVVGDGPERERIRTLVQEAGMEERVHFAGMCENPWSLMRHADILVHPSRSEAFPNVFGEAFALGLPVIASDCSPGVREYLRDGACGILVPVGDEAAMAGAISSLAADAAMREQLGRAGLKRVVELNPEASVAHFEEILREASG